jgi:glycosyltransferase involved in cell wall biosynthesis
MSADLWAGAEVQVATVASYLVRRPDVVLTAVLFNDGPLAVELGRLGVPVTVLRESDTRAPRLVEELARLLRTHAVDIAHTHRYKDTVLGALAATLAGVPFLVRTVHGRSEPMRGWDWLKYQAYNTLDRAVLRWRANGMIAVSQTVARDLEPLGGVHAPVVALPNGIDFGKVRPSRFRCDVRHALGADVDTLLIGAVGRLARVKGHAYFLEAARLILEGVPRARFVIVGDGELKAELKRLASRLGVDHACQFLGARADVYDLVSAMDLFVLPSLDEGIPMALLEAMALGAPVVASAVGGIPEVLVDGETGVLVPPANAAALAAACLALARDERRAHAMAAKARSVVERQFSHDMNGQRLVDLYHQVMARGVGATLRSRVQERLALTARPGLR